MLQRTLWLTKQTMFGYAVLILVAVAIIFHLQLELCC
jgi:hypothetical protein